MPEQLRLPDISGNEKEQLTKIRSYLYQIIPQLNFALNNLGTSSSQAATPTSNVIFSSGTQSSASPETTFGSIKALIIKSAEIVNAYYEEISKRLEGVYVAQSDFGTYVQETSHTITESATDTTQRFENVQIILNDANERLLDIDEDLQVSKTAINESIQGVQDGVAGANVLINNTQALLQGSLDDLTAYVTGIDEAIIAIKAYIKSGLIDTTDEGIEVYGIEIGESIENGDGQEAFKKFARFTSEKLSFYDSNSIEVAYISDKKLFIKMAEITVSFKIGGLIDLVMNNGDVVEKWVGG